MEKYSPSRRDLIPHLIFTYPIVFKTNYRKRKGVDLCLSERMSGAERIMRRSEKDSKLRFRVQCYEECMEVLLLYNLTLYICENYN